MDVDLHLTARSRGFADMLDATAVTGRGRDGAAGSALPAETGIERAVGMLLSAREKRGGVYVVGNGGSAAVAAHMANDFVNVAKLRATTLHDPSLFSCMANDYGYDNAFARILETMAGPGDVLIAISSSGNSMNIRNAVDSAHAAGAGAITLSGFKPDNPLRAMGDLNFYTGATDYGLVEIGHLFLLHNLADRIRLGWGAESTRAGAA